MMHYKKLTNQQKITRNILYCILALTIFLSFIIDFYALMNPTYRYLINIAMLGIYGIVFYIGYKKHLFNKIDSIVAIILVATIVTITLFNR